MRLDVFVETKYKFLKESNTISAGAPQFQIQAPLMTNALNLGKSHVSVLELFWEIKHAV